MATLHPFRALRPRPQDVQRVASVPYDVVSTEEARQLASGNPLSFLHVVRPEIDLPPGTDEHDDLVYEKGAENLKAYAGSEHALVERDPALYVYRLVMNGHAQTGLFGCVSVADYDSDVILKHENTRPAKEEDRTRHILTQHAHAEPVMLTYRGDEEVGRLVGVVVGREPLYDFTAEDGVRHILWKVEAPEQLVRAFRPVERLYVADGHHRCAAASRAAARLRGGRKPHPEAEFEFFPAVLFPMQEMRILPYNRIVRRLPADPDAFVEALEKQVELERDVADATPRAPGEVCLYLAGQWHRAVLPPTRHAARADALDVARLNEFVLEPLLGITDPRTDPNLDFVGGIRGTEALERLVDTRQAELALSLYPTSIQDLVEVSDAGQLMPPKSTWFEPKLRSGLLVHLF